MALQDTRRWPAAYAWTAYATSLLLILSPPLDVIAQMNRFDWGVVSWRFGFFGLMASALMLPILGAFIASVTARMRDHRIIAYVVGAGCGLVALLLGTMMVLFILDAIQLRSQVNPEARHIFDPPVIKSVTFQILMIATLVMLTVTNLRGWDTATRTATSGVRTAEGVLVRPSS